MAEKQTPKSKKLPIKSFIVGYMSTFFLIHLMLLLFNAYPPHASEGWTVIFATISLLAFPVSIMVGMLVAKWHLILAPFSRWNTLTRGKKTCIGVLIMLYLLTWLIGVPAVQNTTTQWAIDEYKRLHRGMRIGEDTPFPSHPYIRTFLACPLLPGVVLSYQEYQLAGLYGWGGWTLHVWYGIGAKRVLGWSLWVS